MYTQYDISALGCGANMVSVCYCIIKYFIGVVPTWYVCVTVL